MNTRTPSNDPTLSLLSPPGLSVLQAIVPTQQSSYTSFTLHKDPKIPTLLLSALKIRYRVFIYEQHCDPAKEVDTDDARSWHWVAFAVGKIGESQDEKIVDSAGAGEQSDDQIPVATIRLVPTSPIPKTLALRSPGLNASSPRYGPTALWDGHEAYVKLGRLATLSSHRGQGLAKLLVEAALKWAGENGTVLREDERGGNGWNGLVLVHAQVAVEKFWAGLGFVTDEELGRWWEEDIEHLGMWKRVDLQ